MKTEVTLVAGGGLKVSGPCTIKATGGGQIRRGAEAPRVTLDLEIEGQDAAVESLTPAESGDHQPRVVEP